MTYGLRNVVGGLRLLRRGGVGAAAADARLPQGFFGTEQPLFGARWGSLKLCPGLIEAQPWTLADLWTYAVGAHTGHALDFAVALLCYYLLYWDGAWLQEAREWHISWVSRIVLFNLAAEVVVCNFWHYFTYVSSVYEASVACGAKYNPNNQYEPATGQAGMFRSSTGNLEREVTFSTLGWLQSAAWQCVFTHLWASGALPVYTDFWSCPLYSLFFVWVIAYWREVHFFFAHRGMHPWWDRENGLLNGDVGAFLYRHVHSLHHKSYNPGPWSGLSMHPVEHLLYYSVATLPPLVLCLHPFHFLYTKFHADIAPLGGHDGMDEPFGHGDFHYLHHAKFECNYGVPFPINLDRLFGTWADWETYKATGELSVGAWARGQMHEPEDEDASRAPLLRGDGADEASWTMDDVARHSSREDCFIVLYGQVIDVTAFVGKHPGGEAILLANAGKDATAKFEKIHAASGGFALVEKWCPGATLGSVSGWAGPPPPAAPNAAAKYPGAALLYPLVALTAAATLVC